MLPLAYVQGQTRASLGLSGHETCEVAGLNDDLKPGQRLEVRATAPDGTVKHFPVICRIDTPIEIEYYRHGGILHRVLRQLISSGPTP